VAVLVNGLGFFSYTLARTLPRETTPVHGYGGSCEIAWLYLYPDSSGRPCCYAEGSKGESHSPGRACPEPLQPDYSRLRRLGL
jgi:hypothetical protein